jgi:hypothetical protein
MMELLILVEAPLIVLLFVAMHQYAPASRRSFSLAALRMVVAMTALTLGVHLVLLTLGRQVDQSVVPGFDRFFSFKWPSVVYALDIVAWDFVSVSRCCSPPRCLLEGASSERSASG